MWTYKLLYVHLWICITYINTFDLVPCHILCLEKVAHGKDKAERHWYKKTPSRTRKLGSFCPAAATSTDEIILFF